MNTINTRALGNSGLQVSELGLGTAAMAGNHRPVSEADHRGAIEEALDGGITFLDTACLLYTSPSPRDATLSRMPSSA